MCCVKHHLNFLAGVAFFEQQEVGKISYVICLNLTMYFVWVLVWTCESSAHIYKLVNHLDAVFTYTDTLLQIPSSGLY